MLHVQLLDDLRPHDGLRDTVQDQVRALLREKLSVKHHAEEGLIAHVQALVLGGTNQEVVEDVRVPLDVLPVLVLGALVDGVAEEHLEVLGVAQSHQTVLRVYVRNQMINQIVNQRTALQNLLESAMAHLLHVFVSG